MLHLGVLAAWLALWACVRLLFALPWASRWQDDVEIQKVWWRVTIRVYSEAPGGLSVKLNAQRKRWLQRWFSVGAVAGLLAGAASVAVLSGELRALLRPLLQPGAAASAVAAEAAPRLQLALPGVTLPASHALPLWLALALSLAVHEAGHALAAAAEGVAIHGCGLSIMLLLPAAFVELDTADLATLSRHSMLRVATAGVWHNAVLALAAGLGAAALAPSAEAVTTMQPLLTGASLLLGYTASLSLALALLNMAPVHYLDGEQALEALLLRPRRPLRELPDEERFDECGGSGSGGRAAVAVRWVLHAGTALYAAVVALHLARLR